MLKKLKGKALGLRIIDTDTPPVHEKYADDWIYLHKITAPTYLEAIALMENWVKETLQEGKFQGYLG